MLERGVALAQHEVLSVEDLPPELQDGAPATWPTASSDRPTLQELKRRYIRQVLEETGGNVSRTAAVLGVDRRSLYRMLQRYGLAPRGNTQR